MVKGGIGSEADKGHRAIGKTLLYVSALLGIEVEFDTVGVLGTQLDTEHFSFFAIADKGRQVPVLTPKVRDQAKTHPGARLCFREKLQAAAGGQCTGSEYASTDTKRVPKKLSP
jgi:hypothetical protein